MPATDDEIREKYLERAIRELNTFTRELQSCDRCPRGNLMPVLGSGHPQADVMLLKHAPTPAEVEEGVAFYGRAGTALMKSLKRLDIDPLVVYGTLCVKCPVADPIAGRARVHRAAGRGDRDRAAQDRRGHGHRRARHPQRAAAAARPRGRRVARRDPAPDAVDRGALRARHRPLARRGVRQARLLERVPRTGGPGGATFLRTSRPSSTRSPSRARSTGPIARAAGRQRLRGERLHRRAAGRRGDRAP